MSMVSDSVIRTHLALQKSKMERSGTSASCDIGVIYAGNNEKNSHYYKDVSNLKTIDFYRICDLYEINNSCVQHALKKLLACGIRSGGKSFEQDIIDARDSLNRLLEMMEEDKQDERFGTPFGG